jgi:hypothetical protein
MVGVVGFEAVLVAFLDIVDFYIGVFLVVEETTTSAIRTRKERNIDD